MDTKKIALLAGGTALTLGSMAAYLFLRSPVTVSKEPKLSKEKVMLICKELKTQMFSTSLQIIEKRTHVQKQLDMGARLPNNLTFEDYVLETGNQLFKARQKLVCAKFEVEHEDLVKALEEDFAGDEDIAKITSDIFSVFDNACAGQGPSLDLDPKIIEFLPPNKVQQLHCKFFRLASKKYIKTFQEIKSEGEIQMSFDNPKFLRKIRDLHIPEAKRELLLSEGLDQFQVSPREIFDKITQRYRLEDESFSEKVLQCENDFSNLIDKLAENPFQFTEESPNELFEVAEEAKQ